MATRRARFVQDLDVKAPTKEEYLDALREVWPKRADPDADLSMLRLQVQFGGRITATEMARGMNYSDVLQANGRYGRLGRAIADALSLQSRTGGQWYRAISRNGGNRANAEGAGHFIWEMRPQFESALRTYSPTARIFEEPITSAFEPPANETPPSEVTTAVDADFAASGLEGHERQGLATRRTRAAYIAEAFLRSRQAQCRLTCDDCGFDAQTKAEVLGLTARSLLDVHHTNPLAEGVRVTTMTDFRLLCPTCHRIEHLVMRAASMDCA